MRVLVHDYSGHPFQIQLSRALALRMHDVEHLYSGANPSTPKGAIARRENDPVGLRIAPIQLAKPVRKQAFVERWRLERLYGRRLAACIATSGPDVVLLSNTPLDAASAAALACRRNDIPLVFWLQDLYGDASERILGRRLGALGRLIGRHYKNMERRILRGSSRVIGITEHFRSAAMQIGVSPDAYTTIQNWAPLDEIGPRPKVNAWSRRQGLDGRFVFLYSGTLGFKHNPGLLLSLARAFRTNQNIRVVVNSEGAAAEWLRDRAVAEGLGNLTTNPYQPYDAVPDVLAAADVLVCLLEPEAGSYSVPSKVLSYHCAGRPMLLAVPDGNLAARIVREEGTGLVADPWDLEAFVETAERLYGDGAGRIEMGRRARAYAERAFDIDAITDRFEQVLSAAVESARGARATGAAGGHEC